MKINVRSAPLSRLRGNFLALGIFQGATAKGLKGTAKEANRALGGLLGEVLEGRDFRGRPNETFVVHSRGGLGVKRLLLVGLGKREDFSSDTARQAAAAAATAALSRRLDSIMLTPFGLDGGETGRRAEPAAVGQALAEGAILGSYRFEEYKSKSAEDGKEDEKPPELKEVAVVLTGGRGGAAVRSGVQAGQVVAESVVFARSLANQPSSTHSPAWLAKKASTMARRVGLRCRVLERAEMQKLGMGALLGVSRGSAQPPKFIILEHVPRGRRADTVVVVGKGITFDSGGISIKPSRDMDQMKYDMAGGAAAIGIARAAALLKLNLHVVSLIPAAENLPGGNAYKPGDILKTMSGKTIEVLNTDAEGRVILADALCYAARYKPKAIIDLATLTGAVVIALGSPATGMMGNNRRLLDRLRRSGEATRERVWQLPLWPEYTKKIKSDIADVKNIGDGEAGPITGAAFLQEFVAEGTPWAHLDIAATAWTTKSALPHLPKGATGVGVRLITHLLQNWKRR